MVLDVFHVEVGEAELLQVAEHLRAGEVAEGVAADAELDGQGLPVSGSASANDGRGAGGNTGRGHERAGLNEAAAGKIDFH